MTFEEFDSTFLSSTTEVFSKLYLALFIFIFIYIVLSLFIGIFSHAYESLSVSNCVLTLYIQDSIVVNTMLCKLSLWLASVTQSLGKLIAVIALVHVRHICFTILLIGCATQSLVY